MARAPRDDGRSPEGAAGTGLPRNKTVRRYVLPRETVVVEQHEHWARIAEPVASTVAGFVVACLLTDSTIDSMGSGVWIFWILWAALATRCVVLLLQWRFRWFVATDKRLLLIYGLITHRVAMMPLIKVTDMNYDRTLMGEILGYGRFLMESAGQDQALRKVDFVRQPIETYETLTGTLFGEDSSGRPRNADEDDSRRGFRGNGRGDEAWDDDHRADADGTQPVPLPTDTRPVPVVPIGGAGSPGGRTPPAVPPGQRRITPSAARTQVVDPPAPPPRPPRTWWPRRHDRFDVYPQPPGPGWDVSDEERASFIPVDPDRR